MIEILKKSPGFVYQIGADYYFLGKWICKPCADVEIQDSLAMFHICLDAGETANAALYFQKIRAYSDFALEIPYNPVKIQNDIQTLIEKLSPAEKADLEKQINRFHSLAD